MKRILFIANGPLASPIKGTPIRINQFFQQIKKAHSLTVCSQNMEPDEQIEFIRYPQGSKLSIILFFGRLIKEKKIDIVMITSELAIKLPLILKMLYGVEIAIDLHGLYFEEWYYFKKIGKIKKNSLKLMNKIYLHFYDLIFVVSKQLQDYYAKVNNNIVVIHGGVDLQTFKRLPALQRDYFSIGYAGNFLDYQGIGYILEVAKELKSRAHFKFQLNLVLSGDQNKAETILKEYGLLDQAVINFNVKHDEVNTVLSQSDVLIIARPSVPMTEYAYPSKLPEYLATGIPTILTDVGPVKELFKEDDDFVRVISHKNVVPELLEAICEIQAMDPEQRQIMGHKAVSYIANNLTWDKIGSSINFHLGRLKMKL